MRLVSFCSQSNGLSSPRGNGNTHSLKVFGACRFFFRPSLMVFQSVELPVFQRCQHRDGIFGQRYKVGNAIFCIVGWNHPFTAVKVNVGPSHMPDFTPSLRRQKAQLKQGSDERIFGFKRVPDRLDFLVAQHTVAPTFLGRSAQSATRMVGSKSSRDRKRKDFRNQREGPIGKDFRTTVGNGFNSATTSSVPMSRAFTCRQCGSNWLSSGHWIFAPGFLVRPCVTLHVVVA